MQITMEFELEFTVDVTHYTPGNAGRISNYPELDFPPEPEEIEFDLYCNDVEVDCRMFTQEQYLLIEARVLAAYKKDSHPED